MKNSREHVKIVNISNEESPKNMYNENQVIFKIIETENQ